MKNLKDRSKLGEVKTKEIHFKPIGIIHSPFKQPEGTPIQPQSGRDVEGEVEIFQEYAEGLKDLDGFSHIILIFHIHKARKASLLLKPYMDNELRGVFATRAPSRPNPIGISVVRLDKVEGNILFIRDLDILDGTPLLDIKPFVQEFASTDEIRVGWLKKRIHNMKTTRDDGRFKKGVP